MMFLPFVLLFCVYFLFVVSLLVGNQPSGSLIYGSPDGLDTKLDVLPGAERLTFKV